MISKIEITVTELCICKIRDYCRWVVSLRRRYIDRYRDKKDLAEEVMRLKLSMISPFKPYVPEKFPLVHKEDKYKPSWLKNKEEMMHRRLEQFKDLP